MSNFLIVFLSCLSMIEWVRIEDCENGFEIMMPFRRQVNDSLDSDIGRIYTQNADLFWR